MKRFKRGLCRKLSQQPIWDPWSEVFYSHRTGYFLSGPFGRLAKIDKAVGRLYMKGLASPVFTPENGF